MIKAPSLQTITQSTPRVMTWGWGGHRHPPSSSQSMSPLWSPRWTGNFNLKLQPLPLRILCGSASSTQRERSGSPRPNNPPPPERLYCCKLFTLQSRHNQMASVTTTQFQKNHTERWEDAGSRDGETEAAPSSTLGENGASRRLKCCTDCVHMLFPIHTITQCAAAVCSYGLTMLTTLTTFPSRFSDSTRTLSTGL